MVLSSFVWPSRNRRRKLCDLRGSGCFRLHRIAATVAVRLGRRAGVEVPIAPSWTFKAEYLWTGFPTKTVNYPGSGQSISSDLTLQQFRLRPQLSL